MIADVPCACIWTIDEIVQHPPRAPQRVADGRLALRPAAARGAGVRLAHGGRGIDRPPSALGEHTDEILAEAGYVPADIARLRRDALI